MASLKEVKSRIQSVTSTQQITKAMKMVAAAKLRRAQNNITQMRPYAAKLAGLLQNLSSQNSDDDNGSKYTAQREANNILVMVVTSDKGLCGAFNSNVFKATVKHLQKNYESQLKAGNVDIMPIGKKSLEYFTKRDYNVVSDYWDMFSPTSFETSAKAAEYAMESFSNGKYDKVEIIYNEFKNVATQLLQVEPFLPVTPSEESATSSFEVDYIFQPSREEIVTDLIPKSLKVQVFKAILDSNAAEHGARMTAMDQATDNAGELLKELRLTYNRTRQAAITKEILEIVGGAEALG
ncbi:MAG TPA: ATP synthase F1 subunit gamma [Fulvivirga sp.]|nr:ATP synthase F1 subunit gamma [Fulvivirga sp.]